MMQSIQILRGETGIHIRLIILRSTELAGSSPAGPNKDMYAVSNFLIYVCTNGVKHTTSFQYMTDAVKNGYFDNLSRYNETKSSILFISVGYAGILVMP